ncbi:MAG: hypothetical protein RLZZ338_338 [Cyanobacteriota bacterium]
MLFRENIAGKIRITLLADEESQPSPEDSFRQAWQEIKKGKVYPISELWEGIDAE